MSASAEQLPEAQFARYLKDLYSRHEATRERARAALRQGASPARLREALAAKRIRIEDCYGLLVSLGPHVVDALLAEPLEERDFFALGAALYPRRSLRSEQPILWAEAVAFLARAFERKPHDYVGWLVELALQCEAQRPDLWPQLRAFDDALWACLAQPMQPPRRASLLRAVYVLAPAPARFVRWLIDALRAAAAAGGFELEVVVKCLGAYGALAAAAVPDLTKLLEGRGIDDPISNAASATLARIGPAAREALPALERLRDAAKAAGRSAAPLHAELVAAVREVAGVASEPPRSAQERALAGLVRGLLDRDHGVGDSGTSAAYRTRARIAYLQDVSLVPALESAFADKPTGEEFRALCWILGELIHNTEDPRAKALLQELGSRRKLKKQEMEHLITAAEMARSVEMFDTIVRWIGEHRGLEHSAREYLQEVPDERAIDVIADLIARNPRESLYVSALDRGSVRAIPILLGIAQRPLRTRKQDEADCWSEAIDALGALGDASVTPQLVQLLDDRAFERGRESLVRALTRIHDPRTYPVLLREAQRIVKERDFHELIYDDGAPAWLEGYGTPLVNCLDYFACIGKADATEVLALIAEVRQQELWSRLLPEERAFIEQRL